MSYLYYALLTLFLVLSLFMILLVLIQKGRGGGLSAAFGGVGGNTAFGAKTGDVLTWATASVFVLFVLLAIGLNLLANNIHAANRKYVGPTPASQPSADSMVLTPPTDAPASTSVTPAPVAPAPAATQPAQ